MKPDQKQFRYERGRDAHRDRQFESAVMYGKVKLGEDTLFWKEGFRQYAVDLKGVQRIYRQIERVFGKLCCGGRTYDIQRIILILADGAQLRVTIGDDMHMQAENLMEALKVAHPQIAYSKPA